MSPLVLSSMSAATDAAWLAAADVSAVAHELGAEYRLIGGIAISLLVHHHGVGPGVPDRDTADADMGVLFEVLSDDRLPGALLAHGYAPVESNRFRRRTGGRTLVIDVLGPSWEVGWSPTSGTDRSTSTRCRGSWRPSASNRPSSRCRRR
ncbi:hypothetical protein [Cellulomonas sp. SLBN-39]|uniref:hypothetical protein n=1 Tax=Cellulomonas sp. SLBN-39 TaxID=2768446 RepID=UPI001151EE82|nr:hypothetical protein [Cellulomonas sp. SLBN-39]